jgi:hypothetical protein
MHSDKQTLKDIQKMDSTMLNFHMGMALGGLDKVLRGTEMHEKASPFLAELYMLCHEAGLRAAELEKRNAKPL